MTKASHNYLRVIAAMAVLMAVLIAAQTETAGAVVQGVNGRIFFESNQEGNEGGRSAEQRRPA